MTLLYLILLILRSLVINPLMLQLSNFPTHMYQCVKNAFYKSTILVQGQSEDTMVISDQKL